MNELKSTIVANKYDSVVSQLPSDVQSVTVSSVYNYAATCNLWHHPLVLLNFENKDTNGNKNGINVNRSFFLYSPESNTTNSYVSPQVGTKEKQKYESIKSTLNKRWLLIWMCMAAGIVVCVGNFGQKLPLLGTDDGRMRWAFGIGTCGT